MRSEISELLKSLTLLIKALKYSISALYSIMVEQSKLHFKYFHDILLHHLNVILRADVTHGVAKQQSWTDHILSFGQ